MTGAIITSHRKIEGTIPLAEVGPNVIFEYIFRGL